MFIFNRWENFSLTKNFLLVITTASSGRIHDRVRLGLSEHINDANAVFSLVLDEEDMNSIQEVSKKGKDLLKVIGDCGDEYRRI